MLSVLTMFGWPTKGRPMLVMILVLLALMCACSGAKSKQRSSEPPSTQSCNKTADAGTIDAPPSSYYQIGTCPAVESEP